jgi:hypothetical protein
MAILQFAAAHRPPAMHRHLRQSRLQRDQQQSLTFHALLPASARAALSASACWKDSFSMRAMSSSASPYDGLTVMSLFTPEVCFFGAITR